MIRAQFLEYRQTEPQSTVEGTAKIIAVDTPNISAPLAASSGPSNRHDGAHNHITGPEGRVVDRRVVVGGAELWSFSAVGGATPPTQRSQAGAPPTRNASTSATMAISIQTLMPARPRVAHGERSGPSRSRPAWWRKIHRRRRLRLPPMAAGSRCEACASPGWSGMIPRPGTQRLSPTARCGACPVASLVLL